MLEILMGISLAILGIYFFKSTDLPKELKEMSAKNRSEINIDSSQNISSNKTIIKNFNLPKVTIKENNVTDQELLISARAAKIAAEKALISKRIDELTVIITTLEQELNVNNRRNAEILATIDAHLITLSELQAKNSSLV